jgi:hypothetical protein
MSSDLYRQALDSLSDRERAAFGRWAAWLRAHAISPPAAAMKGAKILKNLEAEAHLVGDGPFGEPTAYAKVLRRCASLDASPAAERHRGYDEVCQEFEGQGLKIPREHLPDGLLRYSSSRGLASTLIQRMLGIRARDSFDREALPPENAFVRLRDRWASSRLAATDRLGRRAKVFATFECPSGAPRDDATALSRALALPLWQGPRTKQEILFELSYPTDAVTNHRFPTVADAGWLYLFQPAPEEAPQKSRPGSCCGWTKPLGGHPAQPEIVHDNASLQVLSEPPRFVGSIP